MSAPIVSAAQLMSELSSLGFLTVNRPDDSHYMLPSMGWVSAFCTHLREQAPNLWPAQVDIAFPQKADCDEIAMIAFGEAQKSVLTSAEPANAGGAIFPADVTIGLGQTLFDTFPGPRNHKVLIVRPPGPDATAWLLLEPFLQRYDTISNLLRTGTLIALLDAGM